MKKKTHGGARKGAGRPPQEPTVVMRIPISKVAAVKKLLKQNKQFTNLTEKEAEFVDKIKLRIHKNWQI